MNIKHNEFTIGLSVTIATLIVIFGILWLGKSNFFVKGLHLKMLVDDANGLATGDEILYRGLQVGSVQNTEIREHHIVIYLKTEKISRLPADSRFRIKEVSLLGEKAVEIIPGYSKKYLQFGDTVKGEVSGGISQVLGRSESYGKRIDDILNNIGNLSGKKTMSSLQNLILELRKTNRNLNDLIKGNLKNALSNIDEITRTNKAAVHTFLDTLARRAGDISLTIKNLKSASASLDSISSDLNSGRGTIGKLLQNDSIYYNMNNTIQHLDSLILDVKQNPEKYFEVKVF